jgi:hypothetical protein
VGYALPGQMGLKPRCLTTILFSKSRALDSLPVAPETCADEFDGREIVGSVLVISRGDASKLRDSIEEALDEITLAVEP